MRWSAAPAARRYVAGWPMEGEIHVLSDEWMERRAGGEDSANALLGTAERMYCQLTLAANNERVPPMWTPRRAITYFGWAWLIEGAAQYFAGQVSLFRPAVITRLREGTKPQFPPTRRDAILLGGTVFDLLDRHAGPEACTILASRLRKEGAIANLELAFDAHAREIEKAWRHHLDDILYPAAATPGADPLQDTGERPSPLEDDKPAPALRKRVTPEPEVDLHDLSLEAPAAGPVADFDAEFEDPFAGEPRIRRGAGLRSPTREDLPPAPDLDFGPAPEFGFEGSGTRVEQGDDEERDGDGEQDPDREPGGRPDPGE